MRAVMTVGVVLVAVALSASCKEPAPACPACPDPGSGTVKPVADAAGVEEYAGYEFRLVEQGGNIAFVGTSSKNRVVVIPLDPRTRMFADGKEGTAGDLLAFSMSTGGCPCAMPRCWPYCRVAQPVLTLGYVEFWGSQEVPKWNLPALSPPPGGAAPGEPAPGSAVPVPAPTP